MSRAVGTARTVFVDGLEAGMIFSEDVVNDFGNVLIVSGTKITEADRMKEYLKQHRVTSVRIKKNEGFSRIEALEPDIEDNAAVRELKYVANFREEFNKIKDNLQKDFESIIKGDGLKKEAIDSNIHKTLQVFKGSMNVFQLIEKMRDLDDITFAHSHNVTLISYAIGQWIGLKENELKSLTIAAMLIDIGKMQIAPEILNKKEVLTKDELDECRKHVIYSYDLIKNLDTIEHNIKQAVLMHHERMDGSGYPMGYRAERITLLARIVAIADIYNALTSYRPHRDKKTPFEAIKILETEYINKLDTKILYIFLRRIGNCFIGQKVRLNDGRRAEIVFLPKQYIYRPVIKLLPSGEMLDLLDPKNEKLSIADFE